MERLNHAVEMSRKYTEAVVCDAVIFGLREEEHQWYIFVCCVDRELQTHNRKDIICTFLSINCVRRVKIGEWE